MARRIGGGEVGLQGGGRRGGVKDGWLEGWEGRGGIEKGDGVRLFVREVEYLSFLPPITVILASSVFTLLK